MPTYRRPWRAPGRAAFRRSFEAQGLTAAVEYNPNAYAILGDSMVAYSHDDLFGNFGTSLSTFTASGGVITLDHTADEYAHLLLPGSKIHGFRSTDSRWNATWEIASVTDQYIAAITAAGVPDGSLPYTTWVGGDMQWQYQALTRRQLWGGYVQGYMAVAGQPADLVTVAAYGGATTQNMIDNDFVSELAGSSAAVVFVSCGGNDIYWTPSETAADIATRALAIIDAIRATGRSVVYNYVRKWTGMDAGMETRLNALNALLVTAFASRANVYPIDATAILPTDVSDPELTVDGTHFSPRGALLLGAGMVTPLAGLFPARTILPVAASTIVSSNPTFTGTGGTKGTGVTGTVADGWTVSRNGTSSAVASLVSRADGHGSDQQIVATPNGAVNTEWVRLVSTSSMHAGVSAGDEIYGVCEVALSGQAQVWKLQAGFDITMGGVTLTAEKGATWGHYPALDTANFTKEKWHQGNRTLTIRTPNMKCPSAPSNLKFSVKLHFDGTGATAGQTIKIGRAAVFKV